jgi:CheY-like chemotaxis protein
MQELSGKSALIIEDNILNQLIASKSLDFVNMKYKIVDDGNEALNIFLSDNYDIILLDINIPGMNGFEIASEIRQLADRKKMSIPIVAVTGSEISDISNKIKASGINDYLLKPYTQEQLYNMILKQLNKSLT